MFHPLPSMRLTGLKAFLVSFSILVMAGCSGTGGNRQPAGPSLPANSSPAGPVTLGAGDTLKMFYPAAPDFNSIQKIRVLPLWSSFHTTVI